MQFRGQLSYAPQTLCMELNLGKYAELKFGQYAQILEVGPSDSRGWFPGLARRARRTKSQLQIQDSSESGINVSHEFPGNLSNPIGEIGFVEGHDLSDVGDGVLQEPGACRWKQDVPGSVE